jgi:hypothetical protein
VLALFCLALASPALAGGALPDGTYECTMDLYIAGDMEIVGSTSKGPAFDRKYDGGPYELTEPINEQKAACEPGSGLIAEDFASCVASCGARQPLHCLSSGEASRY